MNTKLYVAKKDGVPKFLIVENDIFTLEELNAEEAAAIVEEKPRRTYARGGAGKPKKRAEKRKSGQRLCSKCGQPGHTAEDVPSETGGPRGRAGAHRGRA